MAAADYYAILELPRSPAPTPDEVQAAYRRIARLVHPDRNPSPDANAQFQAVQKAYECLKDPEARKLYDQFGAAEAEQYEQTYSAVAKTRIGKILLSDWRWVAAVFGWLLMGYLNRNWLYTPLHWVVPAVAAPFFGPGSFLQQILQGLHWKRPAVVAHASMVGLSALLGLILPVSWITAMSRLTLLIFCLGLGVSIKDDRDIPLTLFVASFFSDIYGKVNNNLINRIIGSHALLSFTIALLPLWLVLGEGGRYPRRSYLTPALVTLVTRVLLPLAAFILLCFPGWIQTILAMLAPCLALDWLFPMPTEWFGFIVLRILFELVDVSLRRVAIKTPLGVAISVAWYYLVPTRYSPAALNAVIYSYLIRQACAFDDRPNAFGRLPRHLRFGTVSWWLVLLAMDALLRNVSTAYPRYAAITAAFAIIATFDVRMPGPRRPRPPQQEAEEEAPSPHTDAPPRARPGPSGRRRRGG